VKIYFVEWCDSEVHGEGKFTVYIIMSLKYRVGDMLPCTVMFIWGTSWGKFYCVRWCVSEVDGDGNITVYSYVCLRYCVREMNIDVCLKYRVRELIMCTGMFFWGTVWGKYYCVYWFVCEVQIEGNIVVYSDVCLMYTLWEMLLCKIMCVWGTGIGKCYCVE